MEDLLRCSLTGSEQVQTARDLCYEMIHFATQLTVAKRRILEDPDLYPPPGENQELSRNDQRNRRRKVCEKLALVPGKLDHATVVAYQVGSVEAPSDVQELEVPRLNAPPPFSVPLASPDSLRSSFISLKTEANY